MDRRIVEVPPDAIAKIKEPKKAEGVSKKQVKVIINKESIENERK